MTAGRVKPMLDKLPDVTFMHLQTGSDLIDKGQNVGSSTTMQRPISARSETGAPIDVGAGGAGGAAAGGAGGASVGGGGSGNGGDSAGVGVEPVARTSVAATTAAAYLPLGLAVSMKRARPAILLRADR